MKTTITKGYDIKLKGKAEQVVADLSYDKVGYTLSDFRYIKPKVLVKVGDQVQKGAPIICDKRNPEIVLVAPASGSIEAINRGARNLLLNVVIKVEGNEAVKFDTLTSDAVAGLSAEQAKEALLQRGLWSYIIRRPYGKIALPTDEPSSLFINCINSSPLAADPEFILKDRVQDFQLGVAILSKLCSKIHICTDGDKGSSIFSAPGAESHQFAGKHPKGNLSVHINEIDPIITNNKVIWSIGAQEVAAIGKTLVSGEFDAERTFAWAGPAAVDKKYYKTNLCASTAALQVEGDDVRKVSGSVLSGTQMCENAFLGYYDDTVIALTEGRKQYFLGWLKPGFDAHSLTRCYVTSFKPKSEYEMTTSNNGEFRAIVDSEMYDRVQPLDINTIFLYKALLAGDVEEAERLGFWAVMPEDFSLASYMDPSKNNFGAAVQNVLDMLHKEEN